MAQAPQPPHKPAAAQPHQQPQPHQSPKSNDKDHLRDPAEGKSPAIGGGHVTKTGEERPTTGEAGPRPTIGVKGTPIEDGERDPDTIAEEQRRRSAEMETMGVEAWKAAHDERSEARVEGTKKLENHKAP